ncbi:hypothetical protein IWX91DRAFT_41899 [Phyllosticta citricarpa]
MHFLFFFFFFFFFVALLHGCMGHFACLVGLDRSGREKRYGDALDDGTNRFAPQTPSRRALLTQDSLIEGSHDDADSLLGRKSCVHRRGGRGPLRDRRDPRIIHLIWVRVRFHGGTWAIRSMIDGLSDSGTSK